MSNTTQQELVTRLEESFQQVNDIFNDIQDDQWETIVFSDGEWSVHHILRHIVTSEYSMNQLIRSIQAGGSGAPENFDIDRFNRGQIRKQAEKSSAELLTMMTNNHQGTLSLLASLDDEDLAKRGRHGGLGRETSIRTIFKIIAGHNLQHAQDVQAALSA